MAKKPLTFEALLDQQYGEPGTPEREAFEQQARWFGISEMLRSARIEKGMTLQQLGDAVGTSKSYLSKVENGKCDMLLSTFFRIVEQGLGMRVVLMLE